MSGLRVAIVTRRFWPVAGSCERAIAKLGQELSRRGVAPSIVTARYDARWPAEVVFRELPVHRLPFPQRFGWGTMRYMIGLSRWLRRNRPDFDLVYVSRLSLEAHATVGAMEGSGIPVVLRVEPEELEDVMRSAGRRRSRRILQRCQGAAAVVTTSETSREQLLEHGFSPQQVHWIPCGVAPAALRGEASKLAARAALATVNDDLRVGLNMPVVTCISPMQPEYELDVLIKAWQRVAELHPHARLWCIGDGTHRDRLYAMLRDADLFGRVLLPGTFDDLSEVLRASDLLVAPSAAVDQTVTLLDAMAAQVPVIAVSRPEHDDLLCHGNTGRLLARWDSAELAEVVHTALADPQQCEKMAGAAYGHVQHHYSLPAAARQHYQLFSDLIRSSKRLVP